MIKYPPKSTFGWWKPLVTLNSGIVLLTQLTRTPWRKYGLNCYPCGMPWEPRNAQWSTLIHLVRIRFLPDGRVSGCDNCRVRYGACFDAGAAEGVRSWGLQIEAADWKRGCQEGPTESESSGAHTAHGGSTDYKTYLDKLAWTLEVDSKNERTFPLHGICPENRFAQKTIGGSQLDVEQTQKCRIHVKSICNRLSLLSAMIVLICNHEQNHH